MPGIAGLVSDSTEQHLFNSMHAVLNHHHYAISIFEKNGIHAAHVQRQGDTSGIRHSADGAYSILFDGELFSVVGEKAEGITDSATHFLKLISENSLEVLKKINGQFSAWVHNHQTNTTHLISDRFSTHPLYYTVHKNRLLFATEVKALLKDSLEKKIDFHGIAELFSFGHLFGNKTLFENIHLLPPATILTYHNNTITQTQYWTHPYSEETYHPQKINTKKSKELSEQLRQILINATQKQSTHADKFLLPLSGGLDSRYIAALYHHIGKQNLTTFTMGPDESEDQQYGSQVAHALGFSHTKFEINPQKIWEAARKFSYMADGMSFLSGPIQILEPLEHFSNTKEIAPVSQMCDALFGSSLWRKRIRTLQANKEPRSVSNDILINLYNLYDRNQIQKLFRPEVFSKTEELYHIEPKKYCNPEYHPLHNYYRLLMNEHGRRGTLGGNIAINAHYTTRMLTYDNDVFDFGWSLPIAYREHQYLYRKVFTDMFPELAKIKREGYNLKIGASQTTYELKVIENKIAKIALGSPLKPIASLYKPWVRPNYVNYTAWFRDDLKENITNFLTTKKLKSAEILNTQYVKTLVDEHLQGKRDNSPLLWQLINLEYFYQNFID